MTALELLESLNILDEQERIEAKRGSEVGKSLLETVCAFANEPGLGGGWLVLGVVREDVAPFPAYVVEGIAQPDKVAGDLATQCREVFSSPVRIDVATEQVQGKAVIVVFVPEAQPQDKPVFFRSQGVPRGAFRRIGSTDQHCTDDDMVVFYQGRQQESFDAGIVADTTLADLSPEAIADYRTSRAEANPDAEELRWPDPDLLKALGCIRLSRPDPQGGASDWKPTLAGLILFGTPQALRRCFPMTRVDYIRVPGREWVPDPDRRFDSIELRDSLFRLIRRVQAAVLDDLPKAFGLGEGELQRTDTPVIPLRVIREALVNALMHRSYRSHSPVQIIRYANRLEIRNPGFSLKSPDHLGEPGSQPRNPKIAAVLHETRFAETKGSGIRVMRESMGEAGLTPPLFESDRANDQFVARYFFHHFLGQDDVAWLAHFKELHLSDEDAKALIVVREAGAIDNATYRTLNKVDPLTASGALRRLRDAGLLAQKGRGSATYYVPTEHLLSRDLDGLSRESSTPLSRESTPLSRDLDGLSRESALLSRESDDLAGESTTLHQEARRGLLTHMPGDLAARLGALGRRSPPNDVRAVVLDLLRTREWRLEELATVLQRNPEYIRQKYIQPLFQQGLLTMTRPEEPNDPQQAYRATDAEGSS
ncbi:MAG: ATP-dependent helicase RecG [Acidobacteriota bacterium]|nr:ATP-dependent helicase RecG [Acidobacteriota bacterium]